MDAVAISPIRLVATAIAVSSTVGSSVPDGRRPDVAEQHRGVGEEDRVELAPLGGPGEPLEVGDVGVGVRVALRQPPGGLVVPGAHQERVQMQRTSLIRKGGLIMGIVQSETEERDADVA